MTTTGIIALVGVILSVVAAVCGYLDKSESKTDHAFIWLAAGGALATMLRIYIVFCQHLSWWGHYSPWDYLQGIPMAIFVAYFWNDPLLFPGGWNLASFTLIVAIVIAVALVFWGLVIWPLGLFCWGVYCFSHKFD